jgi:bifunctional ADP-heptose synthase (sugar kinase/adenylyltransferase)
VVVVGDLMLDREVLGSVDRMCPEAPVPVLDQVEVLDRPGGAGLAALFAASAAGPGQALPGLAGLGAHGPDLATGPHRGREVILVAAVSADAAGDRLRELLAHARVRLVEVPLLGPTPEKIRLRAGDHLLMRLDRGCGPSELGRAPAEAVSVIHEAGAILVSDYGRGIAGHPQLRAALAERAQHVPVVWDPHPRGGPPVPATRLVTPNRSEAAGFVASKSDLANSGDWPFTVALHVHPSGGEAAVGGANANANPNGNGNGSANGNPNGNGNANGNANVNGNGNGNANANGNGNGNGNANANGNGNGNANANGNGNGNAHGNGRRAAADLAQAAGTAARLRRYWDADAVVVTLADQGAVLSDGVQPPLLVPTPFNAHGDSCGAGDRFAATAVACLAEGSTTLDAVTAAVAAATAYVAAGGALALGPEVHEHSDDTNSVTTAVGLARVAAPGGTGPSLS